MKYSIRKEERPRDNGRWKTYYVIYRDDQRLSTFTTRDAARAEITLLKQKSRLCPVCADGACETKSKMCGK